MIKLKYIAVVMLLLFIAGCSHVESYLDVAKDKGISKKYLNNLNQWTKKDTLYSQFETKVQIGATFKNEAFTKAYIEEYTRIFYLTDGERKRMEDIHSDFSGNFTEFFLYASMSQKEANDFESQHSSWSIFLIDEKGNRIKPLEVRKIEKITPVLEEFFPYVNKYYGYCYSLKFPPEIGYTKAGTNATQPITLVFTSVLGKVELSWP